MNDWTLPGLLDRFRSEAECRAWLEAARWPNGVRCPRCSSELVRRLSTRPTRFDCRDCRYRFSVTSGTPLHGTHLPLKTWLLAMDLMATSTHSGSARRLSLWLGIGYRSAWRLAHRIRALMAADPLLGQRLTGIMEADETHIGGKPRKRNGSPRPRRGRISGRGNGNPLCVGGVDARNRDGERFRCLWCERRIHADVNAARIIGRRRSPSIGSGLVMKAGILPEAVCRFLERYPRPKQGRSGPEGRPADPRWTNSYFRGWCTSVTSMLPTRAAPLHGAARQ